MPISKKKKNSIDVVFNILACKIKLNRHWWWGASAECSATDSTISQYESRMFALNWPGKSAADLRIGARRSHLNHIRAARFVCHTSPWEIGQSLIHGISQGWRRHTHSSLIGSEVHWICGGNEDKVENNRPVWRLPLIPSRPVGRTNTD